MSQLLRQADDEFNRTNEQQTRSTVNARIGDTEATAQRKSTSRGGLSLSQGQITLANGANNNISLDYATYVRVAGPTASFSISGIKNGEKGAFIVLRNTTAQAMTLSNEGASSTAGNRIKTPRNADLVIAAAANGSAVLLAYDITLLRWVVLTKDSLSILDITGLGSGVATMLGTFSSANIAAACTDETGTAGALVFSASPVLTGNPVLAAATATSINKVTLTQPATGSTLTIVDGKTLTANKTITLDGVDSKTLSVNKTLTLDGVDSKTLTINKSLTLDGADGKTLKVDNSLEFAGTDSTVMTMPPASASLGYIGLPQNSQSTAYTTVLADSGKHILHPVADNNARTFTIDSNANVPYIIGTVLTFVNEINTLTIAITTDTLHLAATATTGSRTLAVYGMATALKITATSWVISGAGLS